MNQSNKTLWIIFLTIFIDMLGIGILIPVFPLLITHGSEFRVTPDAWNTTQSFVMAGWLLAAYPLAQFFCTPILGQLSDRFGRKKLLSLSISGTVISYLLFGIGILTKNLPLLFFARILDGMSGGNISIAQAVIGDVSSPESRAKNFGLIGVSIGVGFVLGPFIGGKLSDPSLSVHFNAATPFWFAAVLSSINVIWVVYFLPETLKTRIGKDFNLMRPIHNLRQVFKRDYLRMVIPALFLFNAGFTFFTTFWGVVLVEQFDFNQGQVGNFFAYLGIMIILAQGGFVRRLSGKVRDYKVLNISMFLTGACLFVYYLLPNGYKVGIYLVPPVLAVGTALTKSFSSAVITRLSPADSLGESMGVSSSANALAQVIPALLAGYIAAYHARLPVLVGAIIVGLAGLIFLMSFSSRAKLK